MQQKAVIALELGGSHIKLGLVRGTDILVSDELAIVHAATQRNELTTGKFYQDRGEVAW